MSNHASRIAKRGFFVTGTDTGVGKTLVACALLRALADRGRRAAGMKPVAAGAARGPRGLLNEDVERLLAAGNVAVPRELANPYCFEPPIAPHLAASEAGCEIDIDRIAAAYHAISSRADVVVVEGAGGLLVPLNGGADLADLALRLELPLILVVGMRLGCLNHALLSVAAARARGLELAGWIANHVDSAMARPAENVDALERRIAAPCLGRIAYARAPDPARVARALDVNTLIGRS